MKLRMLRPALPILDTARVPVLPPLRRRERLGMDDRLRGRRAVERRARWLRQHPLCVSCEAEGRAVAAVEVDHVVPLHLGGEDHERNFQSLCREHHAAKTAAEAAERARQGGQPATPTPAAPRDDDDDGRFTIA